MKNAIEIRPQPFDKVEKSKDFPTKNFMNIFPKSTGKIKNITILQTFFSRKSLQSLVQKFRFGPAKSRHKKLTLLFSNTLSYYWSVL
jgi:hypothetical protein